MKKFLIKFWWLLLIGLLAIGFFVFKTNKASAVDKTKKSFTVEKRSLTDMLSLSGQIDAKEKADLRFQTSGRLAWVGVKEGDLVKKFQVIASLDKRDLQNRMGQLLNTYSKQRNDFEQSQQDNKDWQTNAMTDAARDTVKRTLQKGQWDLNNSVLAVEAQNLTLQFANLWTPIDGIVTKVDIEQAGVNITPSSATFGVVNPKTIYFSTLADQTEVVKFVVGQKGEITLDAYPGQKFDGVVEGIAFIPKAGETGTVYEVKVKMTIPNENYAIKMGMTGDASFVFSQKDNVLVIPESYIKKVDGKKYVRKLVGDKFQQFLITTNASVDGEVEVTSGLNEGEKIYSWQ